MSAVTRVGTPATTFAGRLPRVGSSTSTAGTIGTLSVCPSTTPSGGGATDVSGTNVLEVAAAVVEVSSGRLACTWVVTVESDPRVVLAPVVVAVSDVDGPPATVAVGDGSELGGLGTSCAPA